MRLRPAFLLLASLTLACVHRGNTNEEEAPRPAPLTLRVKNENYLDVNVWALVSGVTHRLGTVNGNGSGTFKIQYSLVSSESFALVVTPIGGGGSYTSPSLSVASGQVIEMRVGSSLRQTTVVVHEP